MKRYVATFELPTGFIGAGITDERDYEFPDEYDDVQIEDEIEVDFKQWVDEILEEMRNDASFEYKEEK